MDAHLCNHPKVPHTVIWCSEIKGAPSHMDRPFEDLEDALTFSHKIIRQNKDHLTWLKIYRSDNELYSCFVWEKPKEDKVEVGKVKLEIDMEPLASAFENVAEGFKNQGRAIKRLTISQTVLGLTITIDIVRQIFF